MTAPPRLAPIFCATLLLSACGKGTATRSSEPPGSAGTAAAGGSSVTAGAGGNAGGVDSGVSDAGDVLDQAGSGSDAAAGGASGSASDAAAPTGLALYGAPLLYDPTANSFSINAVTTGGSAADLRAAVRRRGALGYADPIAPNNPIETIAQWTVSDLEPGTHYEYQITRVGEAAAGDDSDVLFEGRVITQRPPGQDFSFTLITDSHVPQPLDEAQQRYEIEATYGAVIKDVTDLERPDFIVNLGDMLDYHLYGFNAPPARAEGARDAYMNYRSLMGPLLGNAPHFPVIGNWEGENGCFDDEVIERSRGQRLLYMPAPGPDTFPEGASPNQDYYAFQWGDALFIVLNVMTYTRTCHDLAVAGGTPEDWTLGKEQMSWFAKTLDEATSKWRFVLIHHVVGGAAGDQANSNYGRGGGQSAYIGEQALVHQMMLEAGVQIFFYGHDHVFTDMVVDGIHYTLPGSAGAPWKFSTFETGYVNYWPDSGYGRVHVSPDDVSVEFVAQGGAELYSYRIPDADHVSLNTPPLLPGADAGMVVSDGGLQSSDAGPSDGPVTTDASL